ncbi:MAG: tetratricopeptide repeat protein [Chloroflexota bacterium]
MTDQLSAPLDEFKPRELEILAMMAEGHSNREIAEQLFITKETVRWYNKQIYSKLGTSRRTEAIALAQKFGLIGSAAPAEPDVPSTTTLPAEPPHLPNPVGPFIGRDAELRDLTVLLQQPEVRLVSIIAAGGMGKSRLSLELAHMVKPDYEHGAVFIDLTTVRSPDAIVRAALNSLRVPLNDKRDADDQLLDYCRDKTLLMIFDNMEHLLPGAALLARLLEIAPNVAIIATTREQLKLRVESTYYLLPITEDAAALFTETAAMMHPGFEITEDDMPDVQRVVDLTGGMPLALILAATWVNILTVAEIADEIEQSLEILSTEAVDMPPRQRSIHAVINPTWQRLSNKEKKAFMWASTFRGGFTRQTFQQVTGASIRVLQTLLSRSLIMPGYSRRYDMHPILRQYAREKLEASGEFAAATAAHLQAMVDFATEQNHAMYTGSYLPALDAIETEQDNFRAAMERAFNGGEVEPGTRLAIALSEYFLIRSHAYEGEYYLSQAIQRSPPDALLAPALCWRGRFHERLGNTNATVEDVQAAITLAETLNDRVTLAQSLRVLSDFDSDSAESLTTLNRALEIARQTDNPQLTAMIHNTIGTHLAFMRNHTEALAHYEQAQTLFEQIGDLRGVSQIVYNASLLYDATGDVERSRAYLEQSMELKKQIGDRAGLARRLGVMANRLMKDEEMEEALHLIVQSRQLCEEVGDRIRWSYAVLTEAQVEFMSMDFEAARGTLEEGLAVVEEIQHHRRIVEFHSVLALVHLTQNNIPQAIHYITQGLHTAAKIRIPYYIWLALTDYAPVLWATGHQDMSQKLAAVIYHHPMPQDWFAMKYVVNPHIYRIEQHVGTEQWQAVLQQYADLSLEDAFDEAMVTLTDYSSGPA